MPYLIDGHNLIGQMPGLRLDDPDDEQKLVMLLRRYLARARKTGTVVFDRGDPAARRSLSSRTLNVLFAAPPRTADDALLDRLRRERNPRAWTLVTSDARLAALARQSGATVRDAASFAREVARAAARPAPGRPQPKEAGLTEAEVAEWEQAFKDRDRFSSST